MSELPTDRQVFQMTFPVQPEDIDELNHVNNVVYVQWVQDVAEAHWNQAATLELKSACQWVVLRHEVDYKSPAVAGDMITAYTWIELPKGPLQKRFVRICRGPEQKILAEACTT
jgi:acyl-CoA thioester hydrolase